MRSSLLQKFKENFYSKLLRANTIYAIHYFIFRDNKKSTIFSQMEYNSSLFIELPKKKKIFCFGCTDT